MYRYYCCTCLSLVCLVRSFSHSSQNLDSDFGIHVFCFFLCFVRGSSFWFFSFSFISFILLERKKCFLVCSISNYFLRSSFFFVSKKIKKNLFWRTNDEFFTKRTMLKNIYLFSTPLSLFFSLPSLNSSILYRYYKKFNICF